MTDQPKIVLHCPSGYQPKLDALVAEWMQIGVKYVGVVGHDASRVEDIIDELCVGDGSSPYDMLTAFHEPPATVRDAIALAEQIADDFGKSVQVVVL